MVRTLLAGAAALASAAVMFVVGYVLGDAGRREAERERDAAQADLAKVPALLSAAEAAHAAELEAAVKLARVQAEVATREQLAREAGDRLQRTEYPPPP